MQKPTRTSPALVLSALVFLVLGASAWVSGAPSAGAAQITPVIVTAAPTTAVAPTTAAVPTIAALPTTAAATATSPAAASPTAGATATSAAASPTLAATPAATAAATATLAPTATLAATAAATVTLAPTATTAATAAAIVTLAPTSTPPPTPTIPLATSTAVMIVTPVAAAVVAPAQLDAYVAGIPQQLQYYNGPNAQYPIDWYLQRHLGNPAQFAMYRSEPLGLCNTYYYQFQGVYYCYTAGAAAAMPDYLAPGMAVFQPSVLGPGSLPPGMSIGVVPGMVGGIVQTPSGYAVQSAWANVNPMHQYYYGPNYQYDDDWYRQRHLGNPSLYRVYSYEPGGQCASYFYRWQDRFFCYTGGSAGAGSSAIFAPPPPGVAVDPYAAYQYQSYWGQVDPQQQYYYGADYGYDDGWYQQRHLGNPLLYRPYSFEPVNDCSTYYYRYQSQYYCYTGAYDYSTDNASWSVPIRYWGQVDQQQRYYYGPTYGYDDSWYQQRHVSYPDLYRPYDYEPSRECGTYYYAYQSAYYCYTGD